MGLKPGKATGAMPSTPAFEEQCRAFLLEQIRIVNPSVAIALGNEARVRIQRAGPAIPWTHAMHPSAREFKPLATRAERVSAQGEALKAFLLKVNAAPAAGGS
jgi:uracil-DNA glycosylase